MNPERIQETSFRSIGISVNLFLSERTLTDRSYFDESFSSSWLRTEGFHFVTLSPLRFARPMCDGRVPKAAA